MKNWIDDFRSRCGTHLKVKLMEKYLDVENILLKENEELFEKYGLFKENWFIVEGYRL